MSGVSDAGVRKVPEGTGWMRETLLDKNTYCIRNTDPGCQKTLLRFKSKTFGPVRIVRQANLYGCDSKSVQNHRLVALNADGRILSELHYSPRKISRNPEIKIHQISSIEDNVGLASSLLAVLCSLEPGVPKTLNALPSALPKYEHLGFVRTHSGSTNMQLSGDPTPQDWVRKKFFLFKGKRKVFIK